MTTKSDNSRNGIPTWAGPWAASWTSMQNGERARQTHELPKDAHRRIQRIGVAATSAAATIWVLAMVWVWQVIA